MGYERMKLTDPGQVVTVKIDDQTTMIRMSNPVHGPISADEALIRAAWLIYHAAPYSKLKVAELLKQIQSGKKH